MAKRCTRCGNFLMDDERFCSRCGENVGDVIPAQPVMPQGPAGQPGQMNGNPGDAYTQNHAMPGVPGGQPYTYGPQMQAKQEEMSLGSWIGVVIITTFFGIISLIFLFIWGFGEGPDARQKYCKAMLVVKLISLVLGIILLIVWFGVFGTVINELIDYIRTHPDTIPDIGQFTSAIFGA